MSKGKWAVVLAVLVVLAAIALAYAAGQAKAAAPEVVRAQRFEVVDAEGRVRIALAMGGENGQSPGLALLDAKGKSRAVDHRGCPG